ncbi:S26 family signal peptidase, partial [Enterococcus faecalis]|uniref:S26 family signal peptidase n=1 Tax=Enterococcus faecalis TaxID=1351 RepID=UPI003D6B9237
EVAMYVVIACKAPLASTGTYVKRIIGVAGDRIWVIETKLYLSEEPIASDNEGLPENASRFDLSEEGAAQLRLFQKIPAGH